MQISEISYKKDYVFNKTEFIIVPMLNLLKQISNQEGKRREKKKIFARPFIEGKFFAGLGLGLFLVS